MDESLCDYWCFINRLKRRYGGITMKRIGLGIAIILFAILIEVSWSGYFAYITSGIGLIGLLIAVAGFVSKEK